MEKLSIHKRAINPKDAMELSRSYNLLYPINKLKTLLAAIFPDLDLSNMSKYQIHTCINDIIVNNYSGEPKIKSLLIKAFLKENVVSAFEIRTNRSRLDFLRINGYSISYEIKSEVDNLNKLEQQVEQYQKLFEYNNVVITGNHLYEAKKILPENYGILVVEKEQLNAHRKAKRNLRLSFKHQLSLFTKRELSYFFPGLNKEQIIINYTEADINSLFKEMLKKRYWKRWQFLTENADAILPIDYQYFFHHNISPSTIYC